jgi:hypothetical protein
VTTGDGPVHVTVRTWPETHGALLPAPGLQAERVWRRTSVALGASAAAEPRVGLEARPTPVSSAALDGPAGSVRVSTDAGWHRLDGDTWRHDGPAVEASLRVFTTLDPDGAHLLERLHVGCAGALGRPGVEHLPDDLGDGVLADGMLVTRALETDGALALRVDLVRHTPDLDVVVSSIVADPSVADGSVTALVRLLAAVRLTTDPELASVDQTGVPA